MTTHRFFITPDQIDNKTVFLLGDQAHKITNVLRLHDRDHILVLDNTGWEYELKLVSAESAQVVGTIISKQRENSEPTLNLTLYQSLLKRDKFEWVLQKGTELGVTSFVPIISQRTIVRQASIKENKLARWQRIIIEAAEQSGRGQIPVLSRPISFHAALKYAKENDLVLIPWENEKEKDISAALAGSAMSSSIGTISNTALFIGPEGGFAEEEILTAKSSGIIPITLGPRILRAETAAIVATTILLHESGELK